MMKKKALITGASQGIGYEIARQLVPFGFDITAVARNETKLKAVVKELGEGHRYLVADLSSDAGQDTVMAELQSQHYDLLINNAGVGLVGTFSELPLDQQISMMRVNCEAVVKLSHAFLKQARSGDALLNTSSVLGFTPMPGMGLYAATKAFVTSLTESIWFDQKSRGVYVMALCPGSTSSEFQVHAGGKLEDIPKGLLQTPHEVAAFALRALVARKKPSVISGVKNVMYAGLSRILTRKSLVTMTGGMMKS